MKLVRKKLVFSCLEKCKIQYNYNHNVQKEIYQAIEISDTDFFKWLHDEGYIYKEENFKVKYKLFSFQVYFDNVEYKKDGIYLSENSNIVVILSGVEEIVTNAINGFIKIQIINISNNTFYISNILHDDKVIFKDVTLYKVRTPLSVVRQKNKEVEIFEDDFFRIIGENLKKKYKLIYGKEYKGELFFDIENILSAKKKCISIKQGYVYGYSGFELYIQAEKDMQKVAYYCGLGTKNSLGLGFLTYITGKGDLY